MSEKNERMKELRSEGQSLQNIGNIFGISRERVRQIVSSPTCDEIKKRQARIAIKSGVKKGLIQPQPCKTCGSNKVEAHHPDYDKPTEIEWLCREHHNAIHAQEKGKERKKGTGKFTNYLFRQTEDFEYSINDNSVTVTEASKIIRCSPRTVRTMIKEEIITAYKLNPESKSIYRIPQSEVERIVRLRTR